MKIALLNLSNNITNFSTVSSGETLYIKKMLKLLEHNVDVISKTNTENTIAFEDVDDINIYDKLLVINGAINFFGGKENPIIINNYKLMAQYNKPIYYLLTDLRLPFKQLWKDIERRNWGYKKEDVWVDSKINVISQSHNLDMVRKLMPDVHQIFYYPLERYILLFPKQDESSSLLFKNVDLIYGGSFRSGNRKDKMLEYFFDTDYSTEMFGNIKEKQFKVEDKKPPHFSGKVKMDEVINKNSEGYASLILGDKNYNNNMLTLRVWEVLLSDSVILIDEDFDPEHLIMKNDWYYVNNKQDVSQRLKDIKQNKEKYLQYQKERINDLFDEEEYLKKLEWIINED